MPRENAAEKGAAAKADRRPVTQEKSKTYRLSERKVAAAQAILGTETATEAIEAALDMVVFRKELVEGAAAMLGIELAPPSGRRRRRSSAAGGS